MIEKDVKVAARVIKEVLYKTAIEEIAVNVELLVAINHVLELDGVVGVPHLAVLALRWLVTLLVPVCRNFGLCVLW